MELSSSQSKIASPALLKRPTIDDVARRAEVSVPTVSRVLTGAAKVSPKLQERVEAAIAELGYRPSAVARALVSQAPTAIMILAGNTTLYGYVEIIRGIEERAKEANLGIMIRVVPDASEHSYGSLILPLLDQSIAGVIVLPLGEGERKVIESIPAGAPVITVANTRKSAVPDVSIDEAGASEELTNYLLDLGHKTVHYIQVPTSTGRVTGWRRALRKRGIETPKILSASWNPQDGRRIGHELAKKGDVTAVFCGNDEIAFGVIRGLKEEGLSVPKDVSVVGFDDHPLSSLAVPAITTVHQDFFTLGVHAYERLERFREGKAGRRRVLEEPRIEIRETTGPPKRRA